ncbi:DUF659 domain-containing protein [Mycena kentingensis (nom. inval.)]|nr:DUF659 domain-containing protein [Mycena kentingensis (nom. inval.)]
MPPKKKTTTEPPKPLGALHYGTEIRKLAELLKNVPKSIPLGTEHDFRAHELRQDALLDMGCEKSVVNQDLERSFGSRADGVISFKSRGPGLEAVADVLREYITGTAGQNLILTKWVDDLTAAAKHAIEEAGGKPLRDRRTTESKRRMEDDEDEENLEKRRKLGDVRAKKLRAAVTSAAAELTLQVAKRQIAAKANAAGALSSRVEEAEEDENEGTVDAEEMAGSASVLGDPYQSFRVTGGENKQVALKRFQTRGNLLLLEFLCVSGSAVRHVDTPSFRKLAHHLNPLHGLYSASTMVAYTIDNLTLTFDGATLFGQSVYTGTVTTPKLRESHLMLGSEMSGVSHTGAHIAGVLKPVLISIGPLLFAAIISDHAGNVRLAREIIVQQYPTILSLQDPPHLLSNLMKDICKLDWFELPIEQMRTTITHYSSSTYAGTHLKALRVILGVSKGLEVVGKTRFGTMYWSGYALLRNLPAIHELVRVGIVRTDGSEEQSKLSFLRKTPQYHTFKNLLEQLVTVLEPIARATQCLESSLTTVGDVFKFVVAIKAVHDELFAENTHDIPSNVIAEIRQLVDTPHAGNYWAARPSTLQASSSTLVQYVTSKILRTGPEATVIPGLAPTAPLSQAEPSDKDLRAQIPAYTVVGTFLFDRLRTQLQEDPALSKGRLFARYPNKAAILAALRIQFEAFVRQQPPFNLRDKSWTRVAQFWRAMLDYLDAAVLAYIALRVVGIMPTSMPEERTVSTFTKLTTKDRSRQDAATTIAMTQIRQHVLRRDAPEQKKSPVAPRLNWRSVKSLYAITEAPEPQIAPAPAPVPASPSTPIDLTTDDNEEPVVVDVEAILAAQQLAEEQDAASSGLEALAAEVAGLKGSANAPLYSGNLSGATNLGGVDLTDVFFRDLLSDEPIEGALDSMVPVGTGIAPNDDEGVEEEADIHSMLF